MQEDKDNISYINNEAEKRTLPKHGDQVKIGGLSELNNLSEDQWKVIFRHFRIGEHMLQRRMLTVSQLSDLLEEQSATGEQLGELVVKKGYITREQLFDLLKWQHKADSVIMNLLINMEKDDKDL